MAESKAKVKGEKEFSDPFAEVEITPIEIPGVAVHDNIAVRVKDDAGNWQKSGILSKGYNLIKNSLANETALDVFSRSPFKFVELLKGEKDPHGMTARFFDGKRYLHYYQSVDPVVRDGDLNLHIGALVRNSYDGSGKFAFEIYALNPFCTNQYHARNLFGFFEVRHTVNGSIHFDLDDAVANLARGAENIIAAAPRIVAMKNKPLEIEEIKSAVKAEIVPKSYWGEVIAGLEQATVFGLYQSLTFLASHKMPGLSRVSYGNLIGEHFLPVEKANG
jgi:hypothetical protein